jgi:AcrR family transcriptional regulator
MSPTKRQAQARQSRQEARARIVAAATDLVRRRSYAELSVDAVMERAGIGRTLFYRHFDDLGDMLMQAARDAIQELYQAQVGLAQTRVADDPGVVRAAIEPAVVAYEKHGPVLRAIHEAAAGDEEIAQRYAAMRRQFDDLVAEALVEMGPPQNGSRTPVSETARALNLLNESYLLDAFGRESRVSRDTAVDTLTGIWSSVING